MGLNKPYLKKT